MLEEREARIFKEKIHKEFQKFAQRMEQQQEVPKNDWENLYLILKIGKYVCDVEKASREEVGGYSGYSNRGSYDGSYDGYSGYRGRGANGQFVSRDGGSYAGGGSYANDGYSGASNSYDNQVLDEMMRHASPQEREVLMRLRNKMQQQ